jgi:hypothetical protein
MLTVAQVLVALESEVASRGSVTLSTSSNETNRAAVIVGWYVSVTVSTWCAAPLLAMVIASLRLVTRSGELNL